jgi:hypothetical protein
LRENIPGFNKSPQKEKSLKTKSLASADVKRGNALVKRSGLLLGVALAAAVLATGCPDGSTSDAAPALKGVLGQISGVVLDASTGLPLRGVTVEIAGKKATTDETGYYLLDNVIPNSAEDSYQISYYKSGYKAEQQGDVKVDAQEYKNKDPFYEKQVLDNLAYLFKTWLENTHPTVVAENGGDSLDTWTYSNGVYVNGGGSTVQVTESADGTPNFELLKGLDYTYKFGQSLTTVSLKPLTASLKGKIFLYTDGIDTATALTQAGLKIQFKETTTKTVDEETPSTKTYYGTGETKADGTFEVTGLPVHTDLKLVMPGFVEGEAYYDGKKPQTYDGTKFSEAKFTTVKDPSDVWNVYFKGKTDAAYIVDVTSGEAGAPLPPTAKITVKFSKAIDTKTFTASIKGLDSKEVKGVVDDAKEDLSFDVSWDTDNKVATLTPRNKLSSYAVGGVLPYSTDSAISIGDLEIYAKAADGSGVLDPEKPTEPVTETATTTTGVLDPEKPTEPVTETATTTTGVPSKPIGGPAKFKVYTEEGLKLLKAEIIAATGNAARAVLPIGGALKLTFSKAIAPLVGGTEFKFGKGTDKTAYVAAAYKVDAADAKIVYVYADKPIEADSSLSYTVYAADDTFNDKTTEDNVKVAGISGDNAFSSVFVENPYLGKSNPTDQDKYNADQVSTNVVISGANADWNNKEKIKLAFTDAATEVSPILSSVGTNKANWYYKSGSAYRVISNGSTPVDTEVELDGKELTIKLPDNLGGGGTFYPAFTFKVGENNYTIGPKDIHTSADEEVQITLAADDNADLNTPGDPIAAVQAPIFGVTGAAAISATVNAFTAITAAEDFTTRTLVGYVKSRSDPVWRRLSGADVSLTPSVVSGNTINAPAFNLGSIPAYKGNEVEVKWRGVSSDGRVIETPVRKIVFTDAAPSIAWSGSFREVDASPGNASTGGIAADKVTAALSGWKFADKTLRLNTDYKVDHLPTTGSLSLTLTVSPNRTSVEATLSGAASPHTAADSINNLTITFLYSAFETPQNAGYGADDANYTMSDESFNAEAIRGYSKSDIRINFID